MLSWIEDLINKRRILLKVVKLALFCFNLNNR